MKLSKISKGVLAACAPVAVAVTLSACGGDTTAAVTSTDYSGPGSKWDVSLSSDSTFSITRRDSISDPIDMTVAGSYESLNTGFLKLTVSSASGTNAPSAGDVGYALDVPGYSFFLKPLDSTNDQVISMVKAGACPTTDVDANWVMVKSDGSTTDGSRDFFGTFNYVVATDTPSLPAKYNLSAFTTVSGGGLSGTGSCSNGIMTVTGAAMYLTDNGGAIVHTDAGTPADHTDDQFIFALAQKAIGATSTDGDYAGLLFDDSQSSGAKISPVSLTCNTNVCTANVLTNVETGAIAAGSATVTLTSFDNPSNGFATGTVSSGAGSGNIVCMIDVNASGSGKKVMSCVGQSPGDNTKMFNVLFASKS